MYGCSYPIAIMAQTIALTNLNNFHQTYNMQRFYDFYRVGIEENLEWIVAAWALPSTTPHCDYCALPFTHAGSDYCSYRCEVEHATQPGWENYEEDAPHDATLSSEQNEAVNNLDIYDATYSIGPRMNEFYQAIVSNDAAMIAIWLNPRSYHCNECATGFDDPSITRHNDFCSEACFQAFWDRQDAQQDEHSRAEEPSYDSRQNIKSILSRIQAAAPLSEERLSYIQKLFQCLAGEDRELLENDAFRTQVVRKIEEFNGFYQEHPDLPLRAEVFTAMNRCREVMDSMTGIARA